MMQNNRFFTLQPSYLSPPPLNYHSHLADALQHFVKLTLISGVGKLLFLYVPATSQYFFFLIVRNSHSENIVCQD